MLRVILRQILIEEDIPINAK